jgi:hypothetical protein
MVSGGLYSTSWLAIGAALILGYDFHYNKKAIAQTCQ